MENLYGFRKADAVNLLAFVKEKKGESLSSIFTRYAKISKKSKGTIRNLYYTLTKLSLTDADFREKYLDGKTLKVEEKLEFSPCEERALIKQILKMKGDGVSVRRAVKELARGDEKLALRYQNKYRSLLKSKKSLVIEIVSELKGEKEGFSVSLGREKKFPVFSEVQVGRLKKEINSLFERTFSSLRKENAFLSQENARLREQNEQMRKILYGERGENSVQTYFLNGEKKGEIK